MKHIVFAAFLHIFILYAEPSVYKNINQTNAKNTKAIIQIKRELKRQKERIEGLTSIIEGLSATVNAMSKNHLKPIQNGNSSKINNLLEDLGKMIDEISENYVSRTELEKILNKKEPNGQNISTEKLSDSKSKNQIKEKSISKLYTQAVRLFVKKRYDEAKKRFVITDEKGYKPAASNYYLGEIAYYTKKYEDAIFYFKKSAGLYDKASYLDVLLLHTAISLEMTGEKTQARAFYENIIENYADKKTAEIAKKKLENL